MDDTQSIKDLDVTTLDAANFPGSARTFARVASSNVNEHLRSSTHISSVSPTTLRIAHKPRPKGGAGKQYSLSSAEQTLARLDSNSNPISFSQFAFKISAELPQDVTEAEFLSLAYLHIGGMLANSGANLKALYRGEF